MLGDSAKTIAFVQRDMKGTQTKCYHSQLYVYSNVSMSSK